MLEKLFPIDLPPGLSNNGTKQQARDRWHVGNLARFFQGTKQPIGGWVQRTLTGASITGTVNAAHSWQANDGSCFIAIGTTTKLYVVSSANVVYDITPSGAGWPTATASFFWQLENFGSYLVASVNGPISGSGTQVNICAWDGNVANTASVQYAAAEGPTSVFGVVVTPERFLVALRGEAPTIALVSSPIVAPT
jgi:hypothetical protein